MNDFTDVEGVQPAARLDLDTSPPGPSRRDYANAFALNFVLYAAAILVYAAVMPGRPLQLAVLTTFSLYYSVRRAALIRVVERRFAVQDRDLLLAILDDYLKFKDRWTLTGQNDFQRCYESPMTLGLYRYTGVLRLTLEEDHAILAAQARVMRGLAPEIERVGAGVPVRMV